jgi:choline-sulfatase
LAVVVGSKNILFLCSDQHARHVSGGYGHAQVQTPHLDALAARGTRFANAYTPSPICVSARACIATGRYAHQLGAWDNAAPYTGAEARSWGHTLTEAGITVTTIGKLHYRSAADDTGFPDQRLAMHVKGGSGNLYGLLREHMPPLTTFRPQIANAGVGVSDYAQYDTAVADAAVRWLHNEAPEKPWALMVSFANPHPPFTASSEYLALYPPESITLPDDWQAERWPHHPAIDWLRRQQQIDTPFDEATVRRAIATYYAMVTFVDAQVGRVLAALDEAGLRDTTTIIYTSDHGEMAGEHGLWFKCCMYEASVGVPLLLAGPDVPAGAVCETSVSLVDIAPTLLDVLGVSSGALGAGLPGTSLLDIAHAPAYTRPIFSEFHGALSASGMFMLREGQFKYVFYAGQPPQLFDLDADPLEQHDQFANPDTAPIVATLHARLLTIADPDALDRQAKADQRRRLDAAGGAAALMAQGFNIAYTPPPPITSTNEFH